MREVISTLESPTSLPNVGGAVDGTMPVPADAQVPPTQAHGDEPSPWDFGKSTRTSRYEARESSHFDHLRPFYRIDENDLWEHWIMCFPLSFNNSAIVDEALKMAESMHYDETTWNFIKYVNGVSVHHVWAMCVYVVTVDWSFSFL